MILRSLFDDAYDEGWNEGWKEGWEEGWIKGRNKGFDESRQIERRRLALNLLNSEISDHQITEFTGLTLDEINIIKNESDMYNEMSV